MSRLFEELDYCPTPRGALTRRRRREMRRGVDVYRSNPFPRHQKRQARNEDNSPDIEDHETAMGVPEQALRVEPSALSLDFECAGMD